MDIEYIITTAASALGAGGVGGFLGWKLRRRKETAEVKGDEILVWPTYCDPWGDERVEDFYEGGWRKTLKDGSWVEE